jgi:hypothetical protein
MAVCSACLGEKLMSDWIGLFIAGTNDRLCEDCAGKHDAAKVQEMNQWLDFKLNQDIGIGGEYPALSNAPPDDPYRVWRETVFPTLVGEMKDNRTGEPLNLNEDQTRSLTDLVDRAIADIKTERSV